MWGPFWRFDLTREGEKYGFTFRGRGFDEDFRAESGLIQRLDMAYLGFSPSIKIFGSEESRVERWTGNILLDGYWKHDRLFEGRIPDDPRLHFTSTSRHARGHSIVILAHRPHRRSD